MPDAPKTAHPGRERRRHKRTHVLLSGRLISGAGMAKGLITDLSVTGARVRLDGAASFRSAVTLRLAGLIDFHIKVVWNKGNFLGLKFREDPEEIARIFAGVLPEDCLAV